MNAIGAARFKATCLAVLDQVERTGEPVLVTKRGRPVAQVVAVTPGGKRHPQDSLRGSVTFLGDVVSPVLPPEAWDAARGEGADPVAERSREGEVDGAAHLGHQLEDGTKDGAKRAPSDERRAMRRRR
jgi:prevent-host-death family protein